MEYKITKKPGICGGKACIDGTRIRVIDAVERYKLLKEKPEEIAAAFGIPVQAIFAALSYYYQHPKEIREEIASEKELIRKMRATFKTKLYAT